MVKKLFTFKIEGWSADAAFCCRAVSFAEAFCAFREFVELYAWQGDVRASRLSCVVTPDPAPQDPLVEAYHAVVLGEA